MDILVPNYKIQIVFVFKINLIVSGIYKKLFVYRVEGGRSKDGIEQFRLNNVRVRIEEGTGKQGEWIKVNGGRSKR